MILSFLSRHTMQPSACLELQRTAVRLAALRYQTVNPRVFDSIVHENGADFANKICLYRSRNKR
jgi:hypothetical protein